TCGPDHPNVARSLTNLAVVLLDMDAVPMACSLFEDAIAVYSNAYGFTHPIVKADLLNVAGVLKRAFATREENRGLVQTTRATCLSKLAVVLHDIGEADEARLLLEDALNIDKDAYGNDHPAVTRDIVNLASVLHTLGKPIMEDFRVKQVFEVLRRNDPY